MPFLENPPPTKETSYHTTPLKHVGFPPEKICVHEVVEAKKTHELMKMVGFFFGSCLKHVRIPRDPGSPSENGFMEPKYDLRFVSVIGHPLLII